MAFIKHTGYFDPLNKLAVRIDETEQSSGPGSLSWPEQVVDSIWTALGLLENGSFQYFFECGGDPDLVARAYAEIGMENVCVLFRQAQQLLAPIATDPDWQKRLTFIQQNEREFDRLATEVLSFTLDMEKRLFEYAEKNFPELSHP